MSKLDFHLQLYNHFVQGDVSARDRIDKVVAESNLEQMKKRQRVLTLCEQVRPAIEEILPYCPYPYAAHTFFVHFWRIDLDKRISRNFSELTFMAIAVKNGVAIEHVLVQRKHHYDLFLKVYPSRKPGYFDKRDNP